MELPSHGYIAARLQSYFQKFNKPLPEQFCAKEDGAHQEEASQETEQAYEDSPERRSQHAQLPHDYFPLEPPYPPPYGVWHRHYESSRSGFEWFY
jgi:hypothetical protein